MTERDIFLTALEITDTTARKAYLDKACGGNSVLRAAVDALFASHEGAGSFLNTPIVQTPGTTSSAETKADDPAGSSSAAVEQTVHFAPGQAAHMDDDDDKADEIPLGYLSPSKKPDSLGRLAHYEVLQVLGKGAFGTVLKAFDEKLHRMVAIKVMSIELASTSPARKRFLREARASAAIRHDNVVAIYAVEEQPIPYLVMEYIPGKTLQQALDGHGPLDVNEALRLGQQIASGLAAAHSQGLIHRDIKPANILLEEGIQWKIKITDFGLARAADDASVTQSGTIAGTPMYMSPEQAHSSNIDQRSDLFSFGSVMYQMVSGRPPFRAASTLAVLKRVTEDTPRPIKEIIPEVPDWLVTIISKLHEKKADGRYQTAQEVADLLARCQSELQHAGKVTCVESSHHAPRDEPPTTAPSSSSRPSPNLQPLQPAIAQPSISPQGSSRRSETATFKRPLLFAAFLAVAAIIAVVFINRDKTNPDVANRDPQPTGSVSQIGNQKSPIENSSWHGWPADAPPPAIAPFNADQAKQHQEAWAKYLNVPVDYTNSIGMTFRLIPPGEFLMGSTDEEIEETLKHAGEDKQWQERIRSEGPQHKVILTQPIYLGVYEVTQSEYEKVVGENPSHLAPTGAGKALVEGIDTSRHPVEMVNWHNAAEFCSKLSQQEELKPFYFSGSGRITPLDGTGYRLPTEAEWEYACRAGTTSKYWNGNTDDDLMRAGWLSINTGGRTHAVGELAKNPFGLYDTQGNVWEWVQDGWRPTFYSEFSDKPAVDPNLPYSSESLQAVRGGSWNDYSSSCRVTNRYSVVPLLSNHFLGFRVSLVVDAVRTSLKLTGPAIPKSQAMELSNTAPASQIGNQKSPIENPSWHSWPADAPKPAIAPFDAARTKKHQEEWAAYMKVPVEYTNSIGMKFKLIPPGEFTMGSTKEEIEAALKDVGEDKHWQECIKSEAPQHHVILTQPIYLGVNEVTQTEYEKVMGVNPSHFAPIGAGKDAVAGMETSSHPVETVSWNDAAEFCAKLSKQEELKPFYFRAGETITPLDGTGYRLPTEAEWECACRAGTTTKFWIGDPDEELVRAGWFGTNSGGRTHAVGELKANSFGLSDIHGNVWEWVQDGWEATYYGQLPAKPAANPISPFLAGSKSVIRGGDWDDPVSVCRSSHRHAGFPTYRGHDVGFRVSLPVDAVRQLLKVPASVVANPDPVAVPKVALDLTPPKSLGNWEMGPEPPWFAKVPNLEWSKSSVLPGLIQRPRAIPGIRRWNVDTVQARSGVAQIRVSPDGQWIAMASGDGHLRILDARTLQLSRLLPGGTLTTGVLTVSWHPDSRRIAISADGGASIRIWSIDGTMAYDEFPIGHFAPGVSWSHDGKTLAESHGDGIVLRSPDGKITKTLVSGPGSGCFQGQMDWSPDDSRLIVWHSDGKLRSWNVATREAEILDTVVAGQYPGHRIAVSSKGSIALAAGKTIRYYGPDGRFVREFPSDAWSLVWHPDGNQLLCSGAFTTTLWDAAIESEIGRAGFGSGAGAWNHDGTSCFVVDPSQGTRQFDSNLNQLAHSPNTLSFPVNPLAWSADGSGLLSGSGYFGSVRLWTPDGRQSRSWTEPLLQSGWIAWHPHENSFLSGNRDGIWSGTPEGPAVRIVESDKLDWRGSVAWTIDGRHAAYGTTDGKAKVIDRSGKPVATMATGGLLYTYVGVDPITGRIAVVEPSQPLMLCDPANGWTLHRIGDKPIVNDIGHPVWSPDGRSVSVDPNHWFDGEGKAISSEPRPYGWAWRPDSRRWVTPSGKYGPSAFGVWTAEGKFVAERFAKDWINSIAWHPRGHLLAVGTGQSTITAWREADLQPHWHAVLLPDGKAATFSAAGELISGNAEEVDPSLVYYVEREDGKIETLTPAEFRTLITEADAVQ